MIVDLTTVVTIDNPIADWAKTQDDIPVAMGHVGTHLDTHEKTTVPIEYFKSRGVLFQVQNIVEIGISDIAVDEIQEGDFVIFHTGHLDACGYGGKSYFQSHPQLSNELIQQLIERKVHFVGVDSPGIRQGAEHRDADCVCERGGVYVIENLCNLDQLTPIEQNMTIYTMWLDDPTMTGLRCRVIADGLTSSFTRV